MNYYDPNDRSPRRWAVALTTAYVVLLALSFTLVSFGFELNQARPGETILVDFTEPPVPVPPTPPVVSPTEPRLHERVAVEEQTAQVAGKDEVTQSPNPRALFKMNKGGVDESQDAGNPHAPQGEDKAQGTGPGLNPDGFDQLDKGLQGRGLVGMLPRPAYPGSQSGKIVIRVTVNAAGEVSGAAFEAKGSTSNDPALIAAAVVAARKAKFTESRAAVQGGTITYIFRME